MYTKSSHQGSVFVLQNICTKLHSLVSQFQMSFQRCTLACWCLSLELLNRPESPIGMLPVYPWPSKMLTYAQRDDSLVF